MFSIKSHHIHPTTHMLYLDRNFFFFILITIYFFQRHNVRTTWMHKNAFFLSTMRANTMTGNFSIPHASKSRLPIFCYMHDCNFLNKKFFISSQEICKKVWNKSYCLWVKVEVPFIWENVNMFNYTSFFIYDYADNPSQFTFYLKVL